MTGWYASDGPISAISADDRGLQYGDGLFETIAIRDGRPRLLATHVARLASSCARLGLPYPGDVVVGQLLRDILEQNDRPSRGIVKLVLTAGDGPRGYARPSSPTPRLIGRFSSYDGVDPSLYERGVHVGWSEITASIQPALAGVKSLNRLDQVLARQQLGTDFEHLLCDLESRIICGTMSNIMFVFDEQLVTPDLSRAGVAGVMRSTVMEALGSIIVRDVSRADVGEASEALLCNSQFGVLPVATLDGASFTARTGYDRVRSALQRAGVMEP
ncbi:MAG: aminodeoxychorismate lyase [Pseudomonadota bacterium]